MYPEENGSKQMNKLVMVIDDSLTVRKIVEVSMRRAGITCSVTRAALMRFEV